MAKTDNTPKPVKVVAKRDFRNTHPQFIKIAGAIHPNHVHKGAEFELDTNQHSDDEQADLFHRLVASHAVVLAADTEAVAAVRAEIAADEKAAKARAEQASKAANDPILQLRNAILQLSAGR